MSKLRRLTLPPDTAALRDLRAGDELRLFGPALTARDATHAHLLTTLRSECVHSSLGDLVRGQLLFYAGPTPARAGQAVGSVGPTTASRMDTAAIELMDYGVLASLGKGKRSEDFRQAARQHGAVYLAAVGGAAALLAQHVVSVQILRWPELGTEALMRMELHDFPAFVAIDSEGHDVYHL
ncbi:MAG: fumarate hydratase C-terminal domain-containing protein [Actinomycetes bacterium]|nr:fumarate hydratase C-terminal domain-containing protein [Actinomycetes bacterium]